MLSSEYSSTEEIIIIALLKLLEKNDNINTLKYVRSSFQSNNLKRKTQFLVISLLRGQKRELRKQKLETKGVDGISMGFLFFQDRVSALTTQVFS